MSREKKQPSSRHKSGINGDYFINGYSAEIYNGKHVLWNPILKSDPALLDIWVTRASAIDSNWVEVCYSPALGMFAAVASTGTTDAQIMTSTDGTTWQRGAVSRPG